MAQVIKAVLNLRGDRYPGIILDVDGLRYLRAVMTPDEAAYLDRKQFIEGISRFEKRVLGYDAQLGDNAESKEKYLSDLAQYILGRVEDDRDIRNSVVTRLLERFPTLPDELVSWNDRRKLGIINLDMVELVQVIMGILTPALQMIRENKSENEVQPVVELEAEWQEKMKKLAKQKETEAIAPEEPTEPSLTKEEALRIIEETFPEGISVSVIEVPKDAEGLSVDYFEEEEQAPKPALPNQAALIRQIEELKAKIATLPPDE